MDRMGRMVCLEKEVLLEQLESLASVVKMDLLVLLEHLEIL